MGKSQSAVAQVASRIRGTRGNKCSPKTKFAAVAEVLWPTKTVAELAFRGGVSQRGAKYWMSGKRRPSTRILTEVLRALDQ